MNIHHLELFYFVAKHGGIAAAVRNIILPVRQAGVSPASLFGITSDIQKHPRFPAAVRFFDRKVM
jgi:hypothetical protein